jgi:ADP-ribosylglycohydrolase
MLQFNEDPIGSVDTDTLACITGAVTEAIHGIPAEVADAARSYLTEDLMAVLTGFELATGRSLAARTT